MKHLLPLIAALTMSGCNIHVTDRDAWACLESDKLNFRDPDSVAVVAKLGSRGLPQEGDKQWIRYKATNGFGGYEQANMACRLDADGKWIRDRIAEETAVHKEYGRLLEGAIQRKDPGEGVGAFARAEATVLQSSKNLGQGVK